MNYTLQLDFSNDDQYVWGEVLIDSVICSTLSHTFPKYLRLRYCYNEDAWIYYENIPTCQLERPFRFPVPRRKNVRFMEFEVCYLTDQTWFSIKKCILLLLYIYNNSICILSC